MLTSSRLYVKEFTFDKRSYIKQTIYQKLRSSNGNIFSVTPHISYFSYLPWIAASEGRSSLAQIRDRKQPQEHQHSSPILLEFCHYFPPLCKNHKKMRSIRKLKHARRIDRGLCIFLVEMLKTVSISFINSKRVRTLYSVWLLSNLQWKQ